MKMFFASMMIGWALTASLPAHAYIPPSRTIFEKVVANAGSGAYSLELDVEFQNGGEPLILRETWTVESDRSLRVRVTAAGDLRSKIQMDILYAGGQRWLTRGGKREEGPLPKEFFERFFHLRQLESAAPMLKALGVAPESALDKKPVHRRADEFRYEPEPYVRFARTAGIVAWAYGEPSDAAGTKRPAGLWIEQDQFVIRKLRFNEAAEVIASDYQGYAKGLRFPRSRQVRWAGNEVSIRLVSVGLKANATKELQPSALSASLPPDQLGELPAKAAIQEFYQRFR
jgi:hypothetical protein